MRGKDLGSTVLFLTITKSFLPTYKIIHTWILIIIYVTKNSTENKFWFRTPKQNTSLMNLVSKSLNAALDLF